MFNKSSDIVKYIEDNINTLLKVSYCDDNEDDINECIESYTEELSTFFSRLNTHFKKLESNNIFLGFQEIYNAIITNWDFSDSDDINELRIFVNGLLENIYCVKDKQRSSLIEDDDVMEYAKSLMYSEMQKNMDILIALVLDKKENYWVDALDKLKKIDDEHRKQIIDGIVFDYIQACNSIYALSGKNPVNSETLHEAICKHFSIKRNKFLF